MNSVTCQEERQDVSGGGETNTENLSRLQSLGTNQTATADAGGFLISGVSHGVPIYSLNGYLSVARHYFLKRSATVSTEARMMRQRRAV